MSGTIRGSQVDNSGIVGRPAGHVLQVKAHVVANATVGTTDQNWPSSALGFDNPITPSSDVLVCFSSHLVDANTTATNYVDMYMTGGGFGTNTSGKYWGNAALYQNSGLAQVREKVSTMVLDTLPGSATPTYQIYLMISSNCSLGLYQNYFTLMEIAR